MRPLAVRWQVAPPIHGCRWCGRVWREHANRWTPGHGWHRWTTPTDAQRKARLKAHIASREAQKQEVNA